MKKYLHKIKSVYVRIAMKKKLIIIYLFVGILPMFLIGSIMMNNLKDEILKQHSVQVEAENRRVRNILFNVTYVSANISQTILFDDDLRRLLSEEYESVENVYKAYREYEQINDIASNYTELSSIKVYTNNTTMITNGNFIRVTPDIEETAWYQKAKDSANEVIWVCDTDIDSYSNLRLVRRIPTKNNRSFAIMVISVSNNYLQLMIENTELKTKLCIAGAVAFYDSDHQSINQVISVEEGRRLYGTKVYSVDSNGKPLLMMDSSLAATRGLDHFQIITSDAHAYRQLESSMVNCLLIILLCAVFPIIMIFLFSNQINQRIELVKTQLDHLASGNESASRLLDNSNDEFETMLLNIEKTIHKVQALNEMIYKDRIDKAKMKEQQTRIQFELLANQINPHFFYNTLETIHMKAITQGQKEIAQLTKILGKFMRRTLETSLDRVTLESEIEYTKMYLDIQQYRFGDRIRYQFDIQDVDLKTYTMLPLLLQPIIENAMIHGLESKKEGGIIHVKIRRKGENLLITIEDNGKGVELKQLQFIQGNLSRGTMPKGSIGLYNVNNRIKLFYGGKYGLAIESSAQAYTKVEILLPISGEMHNEKADDR